MNAFLLIAACMADDIPLGLFETFADAKKAAARTTEADIDQYGELLCFINRPTLCNLRVVRFVGGVPVKTTIVPDTIPELQDC